MYEHMDVNDFLVFEYVSIWLDGKLSTIILFCLNMHVMSSQPGRVDLVSKIVKGR